MPSKRPPPKSAADATPANASQGVGTGDPVEMQRRGLWHDVRSLLAAATTNLEYITTLQDIPPEVVEVGREIDHELRLATDVIELVSSTRDPDATCEVDFRALVWLSKRAGGRILVDATLPPFRIRGPFGLLQALADAALRAVSPGRTGKLAYDGAVLVVSGLDAGHAQEIASRSDFGALSVSLAARTDGSLELRRKK